MYTIREILMANQVYWVYILYCDNDSYYTGYTNDLAARYQSHIDGTGKCKYTRSFQPLNIAQCWKIFGEKSLAMKIEREIKKMSRIQKEKIIAQPSTLSTNTQIRTVPKKTRLLLSSS